MLTRGEALIALMIKARVGGAFWDTRLDPWGEGTLESAEKRTIFRLRGLPVEGEAPLGPQERAALAHRLLVEEADYRNPFTGDAMTPEEAVALLSFWRNAIERNPGHDGRRVTGVGIAGWKRAQVRQLLWSGANKPIRFARTADSALRVARRTGGPIIAWPARTARDLPERAAAVGIPFYRIEDGFIRSVGLGAACHPPFSIVIDRRGAHYDPRHPSDLEALLATTEFSPDVLQRADELQALIIASRISKYESGGEAELPPKTRRRVLVTGQVEDDLSVLLGGGDVRNNLDLLRRARDAEPEAEIWFKPHPDVDAGLRRGHVADEQALRHADRVIRDVPMAALFEAIDAIHVLTSLAGFEAMLRGVEVITHGVPFYAGWGLSRDLGPVPERRTRRLNLSQLIAGVLLIYPLYLDPVTNLPCTPETLIRRLSGQARPQDTWLTRLRHLQGRLRGLVNEL